MKSKSKLLKFSTAVFSSCLLSSCLLVPAYADTYHAVEAGETISSVAKRFNISAHSLKTANKLTVADNVQLGSMLLRIPGPYDAVATSNTPPRRPAATSSAQRYFGSITKYSTYIAQTGDTPESIAARFINMGQSTTAAAIRTRNNLSGDVVVGTPLQIPVTTSYGSPLRTAAAQVAPPRASSPVAAAVAAPTTVTSSAPTRVAYSDDRADVSVTVSEEIDLPFARAVEPTGSPVYQAPNAPKAEPKTATTARGRVLASRGGSASPIVTNRSVDGGRILQNGEELVTTPTPRVQTTAAAAAPKGSVAKVAKIAHGGARIRRLPEAAAITLYKCAVGTEIAVLKQKGMWSAILMSDRSTGWIPTKYIKFTGVSVDVSTQVITDNSSDAASNWKSGYNSNHPAVRHALGWLGTRYVYGGTSRRGIDCSSLVQKAFASCGVRLPRVSRDQAKVGKPVSPENLQPGDRLFFSASGTHVDHVGIYMGNGLYVHASGRARQVVVSRLSEPRSWNIFVSARR